MLKLKRIKQNFPIIVFLLFTVLPWMLYGAKYRSKALEYGARLSSGEQEQNDIYIIGGGDENVIEYSGDEEVEEYGTRLSSGEQGRQILILQTKQKTKMRCTTEFPIPPMDSSYMPSSSGEQNYYIGGGDENVIEYSGDEEVQEVTPHTLAPYNVPDTPPDKPYYIDDD